MAIGNIGINTSVNLTGVSFRGTNASSGISAGTNSGRHDSVIPVVSAGQDAVFSQSFQSKENTSATIRHIAWNIGIADKTIGHVNDLVAKMKANLAAIVKMYPPYPPGSQERANILKSYIGLRREIEQLTIPPEYQIARKILSDSSQFTGAGDETISLGEGKGSVTIRNQAINPGPQGLDIPHLSTDASDKEVEAVYAKLSGAEKALNAKREGLASDAYALGRSIEFSDLPTDITEQEALGESNALRHDLAGKVSLTRNNQSLLSLI